MSTLPRRKKRLGPVGREAVRLAKLGLYVGPLKPKTKEPGSYLGKGWPRKTSNAPKVVADWFRDNPDLGLFIHVGRSGLIAFDLDLEDLDALPTEVAAALRLGLFQRSQGKRDRGHYLFRTSEEFGNSAGGFSAWGDVRGKNGAIVSAPSIHPKTKEPYELVRGDWEAVPELPPVLRSLIRAGGTNQKEALGPEELDRLLASLTTGNEHALLEERVSDFRSRVREGQARHGALLSTLMKVMADAKSGKYPASTAVARLRDEFAASFSSPAAGKRSAPHAGEFDGMLAWAAAQLTPGESIAELFDSTPELRMIRRYAQEQMVAPFGLLSAAIPRALSCLPPRYVLPAVVGTPAPLNLFVALVGRSGAGKDATGELVREVLRLPASVEADLYIGRPGSSEGLAKMYGYMKREKKGSGRASRPVFTYSRILASLPEVDSLTALMGRDGSILSATLREVWIGSRFGFDYAHEHTKFVVGSKRYRFCLLLGVQPGRAGSILQGRDGGLPQRFFWASVQPFLEMHQPPTGDSSDLKPIDLPEVPGEAAETERWRQDMATDAPFDELVELTIPDEVRAQILKARELSLLGLTSDNEGHRLLVQEKVAMGLAVIHGKVDGFTRKHWEMAGLMLRASDDTYAGIQREMSERRAKAQERDAEESGRLRHRRSEAQLRAACDAGKARVLVIVDAFEEERVPHSHVSRQLSPTQREVLDMAIGELLKQNLILLKTVKAKNGGVNKYLIRVG